MQTTTSEHSNKLFVGGISPFTNIETMKKHFGQFGELVDCVIMQDKNTGKFRGFGFVTFRNPEVINDVLLETHVIDGKTIDCKKALPRDHIAKAEPSKKAELTTTVKSRKVFVGGLPHTINQESFNKYFSQFGIIESSSIMCDKSTGKARGFGFVIFTTEEAAARVIQNYHKNFIDGKWVECKEAVPKAKLNASKADSDPGFSMSQGISPDAFSKGLLPQQYLTDGYNLPNSYTSIDSDTKSPKYDGPGFSFQVRTVINPETFQKEQIVQLTNLGTPESKPMIGQMSDNRFSPGYQQSSPFNMQQNSSSYYNQYPPFSVPQTRTRNITSPELYSSDRSNFGVNNTQQKRYSVSARKEDSNYFAENFWSTSTPQKQELQRPEPQPFMMQTSPQKQEYQRPEPQPYMIQPQNTNQEFARHQSAPMMNMRSDEIPYQNVPQFNTSAKIQEKLFGSVYQSGKMPLGLDN